MANYDSGELKRVIGVSGLAFTIVNFVVGAGIFVLPAIVGVQLGDFAIFGYIFCAVMMASIMLCYAEIGSKITVTGGSYAYVKAAFGEFPSYIINWLFIIAWSILSDAALINIFADSLSVMFPVFSSGWMRALLFFLSIGFMVVVNILGAKEGVLMVKIITIIKLLPLIGIIILGFTHIQPRALHWEELPSVSTFGNAMLVLFFAFCAFESALGTSGEIKNPQRTVPRGIMLGGLFILVLYLLLQFVTQGVLGNGMEAAKNAPLAAVADKIIGPVGSKVLLLTAALSCFGNVFADILNGPRMLFAGARDRLFPAFLGKVHSKYATPSRAIIIYATLIFIVSVAGGFQQLAVLASAALLLIYLSVVLATIKLRYKEKPEPGKSFRMPGGMLFPAIAIVTIGWLLTSLKKAEILSTIIFIAFVSVIYFVSKNIRKTGSMDMEKLNADAIDTSTSE
ncbi:MAG: APC family permease [Bacteroidetes bacterium]|nr:APC family permease [Bacteroidota bacterium]